MKKITFILLCLMTTIVVSAQSLEELEKQLKQQKETTEKMQKKNKKESKNPAKSTEHEKLLEEISEAQSVGLPLVFDNAQSFSEGLAAVCYKGKWGFVDTAGNFVIAPVHLPNSDKRGKHFHFSEGLVRIGSSHIGFMDKEENEVVRKKFNNASGWDNGKGFSEGLAMITEGSKSDGNIGFIDKTGKKIIPVRYDFAKDFSEGLAVVGKRGYSENAYGYIDKSGKMVISQLYAGANSFSEGLAAVHLGKGKGWGFIDKTGQVVIPCIYENGKSTFVEDEFRFSEGLSTVVLNKKFGYINTAGQEVIPFIYDEARAFSESVAAVKAGEKWGFIDNTGKEIVSPQYDFVRPFSEGLAVVGVKEGSNWKYGYIDREGEVVVALFTCAEANSFSHGRALIKGVPSAVPKGEEGIKSYILAKINGDDYKGEYENVTFKAIFIDKTGKEIIK